MKFVGPWEVLADGNYSEYYREVCFIERLSKDWDLFSVWKWRGIYDHRWRSDNTNILHDSKEEAMKWLDKHLISQGYELLDEERYDKLKLLI